MCGGINFFSHRPLILVHIRANGNHHYEVTNDYDNKIYHNSHICIS
jgi:hypothetical protein